MSLVARLHDFFEDRRLDERERVLIPAELHINDQVIRCVLLNLSTRGAMMASVNPPANGSNILLKCQDIDALATARLDKLFAYLVEGLVVVILSFHRH